MFPPRTPIRRSSNGSPAPDANGPPDGRESVVTVASDARVAPGEPKAVDGSLASFLPRLPILPHVGGESEWDERHKTGHNGHSVPGG